MRYPCFREVMIMKFKLIIDKSRDEEVQVYAHSETDLTAAIEELCREDSFELYGYKDKEAYNLKLQEIQCFVVEDNRIFALTDDSKWQIKYRLYQLEEKLPDGFIKINQSCIANIKFIKRFDASFSGVLNVKFKNGHIDYVSRRNVKNVKERLGL